MGATAAVHPSDQTLQSYGLGKLDRCLGGIGRQTPGRLCRLPEPGGRDVVGQLPRPAARRTGAAGGFGRGTGRIRRYRRPIVVRPV